VVKLAVQRKEAAEMLSIGVDTFDRHVRPYVPVKYVGGVRLYPLVGLVEFLACDAVPPYDAAASSKRPRAADTTGGMPQGGKAP
jgi:hypothetical protein